MFRQEEIGELWAKNVTRTGKIQLDGGGTTSAIWRTFVELNNPCSPKLADKRAIEDELNIDGGKYVLVCF